MQVLHDLPRSEHPDLLVGTNFFDDAGVFRLDKTTALVQTLDFFPPLVEDPFAFGQIAAANALSDVYAMGGEPLTVMNIVGYPDTELPIHLLGDILRGGHERVALAGAVVVGGHSVRDAEIKYGLSVTGRIDPNRILTNGGGQVGDVLVLTKPIGSGVLTGAAKGGKLNEDELAEVIDVMIHLNKGAKDAALATEANAVTDVTGFGLVGHAFEMAEASALTLEIKASAVPLIGRTLELARQHMVTRAHRSTLNHLGPLLHQGDVEPALVNTLCDAQTSGGLLISVPAERADQLVAQLQDNNTPCAAIIGKTLPRADHAIRVV